MASTTSGHVSSNDQQGSSVEESSISADAEADAMDNSLLSLMEVFPDVDPALVVMAFQVIDHIFLYKSSINYFFFDRDIFFRIL